MHNEKVYTPEKVVKLILDEVGFTDNNIVTKHIIDNSCGEGNFIIEIIDRIFANVPNVTKEYLGRFVHGIDIDEKAVAECIRRADEYCANKGILGVEWDIKVENALKYTIYDNEMDFVVGNPPYCNVHHLDNETYRILKDGYSFCQDSMTDLYLAFFEVGIRMMKHKCGKLGYITPNSWLTSKAANEMRKQLVKENLISKVIDFKTDKVFPNATTFTNITILDNTKKKKEVYYYNGSLSGYSFRRLLKFNDIEQAYVNEQLYFNKNIAKIKSIISYEPNSSNKQFLVKNGLATLKDKLFIIEYDDLDAQTEYYVNLYNVSIIDCVKASTGKSKYIIYPYDKNGKSLKYEELCLMTRGLLEERANKLEIDTTKKDWYLYGRTQALNDVSKYKIAVNNIIKANDDIRLTEAQKNVAVYSGFYITQVGMQQTDEANKRLKSLIEQAMTDNLFMEYLEVVGKPKNGGYYTFTTKDLEKYLNYFYDLDELFGSSVLFI